MAGSVIMYPGSSNAGFGPGETLHFFPENGPSTCYLGQLPMQFQRPRIVGRDVPVRQIRNSTLYLRPLLGDRHGHP
jgi:hypothetical protein